VVSDGIACGDQCRRDASPSRTVVRYAAVHVWEQATGDRVIDARATSTRWPPCCTILTGSRRTGSTVQAIIARVLTDRVGVRSTRDTVPGTSTRRCSGRWPSCRRIVSQREGLPKRCRTRAIRCPSVVRPRHKQVRTSAPPRASAGAERAPPRTLDRRGGGSRCCGWGLTRGPPTGSPGSSPHLPTASASRGAVADIFHATAAGSPGRQHRGTRRLAVRSLNATDVRILDGTDGATRPFFRRTASPG
jgi:hypothetical protein